MPDRAPESAKARREVELAAIAGAHGVKGEVRLKLFGEGVEALRRYKRFNHGALTLVALRPDRRGAIARFAEIENRAAAERLRGTVLRVPREALPALGPGEYYHGDLIGLAAVTPDGEALGRCVAVHNFGASDIVEIEKHPMPAKGMKRFMVPMIDKAVISWDEEKLVISPDFVEK